MIRGEAIEAPAHREPHAKTVRWGTLLIGATFLVPGLSISAWSMFSYMRQATDAPILLCAGASAAFDGIGLFAANKAHAFASRGRKAKFAWTIVWAAVAASVLINWRHASAQHWNEGIHILISAPAAAAAAAFELMMQETREEERSRHERRTRTRQSVKIDPDIWLHHPLMVWAERRRESADRLHEALARHAAETANTTANAEHTTTPAEAEPKSLVEADESEGDDAALAALVSSQPPAWASLSKTAAVHRLDEVLPGKTPAEASALLEQVGLAVSPSYVRTVRSRDGQSGEPPHLRAVGE